MPVRPEDFGAVKAGGAKPNPEDFGAVSAKPSDEDWPSPEKIQAWEATGRRGPDPFPIPGSPGWLAHQNSLKYEPPTLGERAMKAGKAVLAGAEGVPMMAGGAAMAGKLPALLERAPNLAKALQSLSPTTWKGLAKMMGFGGVAGGTGEVARQGVEAAGGGETAQRVAEFAAPFLGAGAGSGLANIGAAFMPGSARRAAEQIVKQTASGGKIFPAQQAAQLGEAAGSLRGSKDELSVTANDIFEIFQRQASKITAEAKAQADTIRATSPQKAAEIEAKAGKQIADLENHFKPIAEKSAARADRMTAGAEKVKGQTPGLREASFGEARERSALGAEARGQINARMDALKQARNSQAEADKLAWQADAAFQEQNGMSIASMDEMKGLVGELRQALHGKPGAELRTVSISDPAARREVDGILDSLLGPKKAITKPDGTPGFDRRPPDINAIEEVRRKLGDAAKGIPETGYSAIGQQRAGEIYDKITAAMKSFMPETFDAYLSNYAENSKPLYAFMGRLGKTATSKEGFDWERFSKDASDLPAAIFKSRESLSAFKEMLGDDVASVDHYALKYASRELRDKSATAAKSWLNKANDWLGEVSPEVRARIEGYVSELGRHQSGAAALEKSAKGLRGTSEEALRLLNAGTQNISTLGRSARDAAIAGVEREAGEVEATGQKAAAEVLGDSNPVARLKSILISDRSADNIRKVSSAISHAPGGKELLTKGLREVLSDVDPKSVKAVFSQKVEPALRASGIYTDSEVSSIRSLVDGVDAIANADVVSGAQVSTAINDRMRAVLKQMAGGSLLLAGAGVSMGGGPATEAAELMGAAGLGFGGYWRYRQMLQSFVKDIISDPELARAAIAKPTPTNIGVLKKALAAGAAGVIGGEVAR